MPSLREEIASILDISDTESWEILDSDVAAGLYLIHYAPNASMVRYGSLRGVVVDVPNRMVVARSFGYTPLIKASQLEVAEHDHLIHLKDATNPNVDYTIDPKTTLFYPGFDGVIMCVFLYDGRVYHSTYHSLDAQKESWGNSPTFLQIYHQLDGPSDDTLFDLSKKYSPIVHVFLLAHPYLQSASKTLVGDGYLVYLGPRQMWKVDESPYPQDEIDPQDHGLEGVDTFIPEPEDPVTYLPEPMSLDEVNNYLTFGFHQPFDRSNLEDRLLPGEFVFAFLRKEDQPEITGVLRIESPSYQWRASLQDNSPYFEYRFFLLSNGKFIQTEYDEEKELYLQKFPILTPYSQEDLEGILAVNPIVVWPQKDLSEEEINDILDDPSSRLYNIFLAFLYTLPLIHQDSALAILDDYQEGIRRVTDWLIKIHEKGNIDHEVIPNRARQLIELARIFSRTRLNHEWQSSKEPREDIDTMVREEIKRLVEAEEGSSLFRLYEMSLIRENAFGPEV